MPQYPVTASFSSKEIQEIDDVANGLNISRYKLLKEATKEYLNKNADKKRIITSPNRRIDRENEDDLGESDAEAFDDLTEE